MERFSKKIIYGGSSRIIFDGEPRNPVPFLDDPIPSSKELKFDSDNDLGDYLIENWNQFAYKSRSIMVGERDASKAFSQLRNKLRAEKAAGGVLRKDDTFLMIKRNGFWEFPKGKLEKSEEWELAAMREVEEETGVRGSISFDIHTTYHVYKRKENINLKETRWYGMEVEEVIDLKPQENEGITHVGFFNQSEVEKLLIGSYDNMVKTWELYKFHHNL